MKKKLLAAAIMAALTLSASAALAAPTFSGDANIEYNAQDQGTKTSLINRVRLNVDANIADNMYVHGRIGLQNNLKDATAPGVGTYTDQAYIGAKIGAADLKVGRQSLAIGKGLLADEDNFSGATLTTSVEGVKLMGFYGNRSGSDVNLADMATSFNGINFGASYAKQDQNKYLGLNADTKIMDNATFNVEWVKNNESKADGYLAEVKVGQAMKKGDFAYSVGYYNIDQGAVPTFTTNGNFDGGKGFRVKGQYKVSDTATLTAYHNAGKNVNSDADQARTNVEFSVNF